jgi:hypothetical protein
MTTIAFPKSVSEATAAKGVTKAQYEAKVTRSSRSGDCASSDLTCARDGGRQIPEMALHAFDDQCTGALSRAPCA